MNRATRPHTLNDGSWFISFSAYHVSRQVSGSGKRNIMHVEWAWSIYHSQAGGGKANKYERG